MSLVVSVPLLSALSEWLQGSRFLFTLCSVMVGAVLGSVLLFVRPSKPDLKLPPGPNGLPVLGNLLQMGTHPHRVIATMLKKYGHIIHIRLGSASTIVVDSPNLIAELTKEQDHVFSSRPLLTFTKVVLYDQHDFAMAPYGAYWRHMRRICVQELLTPKRLEATAKERKEESSCMIKFVCEAAQSGKVIDMRDVFSGLSMNVMCRMLLGKREFHATGTKVKDFKHLIHEVFRLMGALNLRDFVPALGWLDLQGFERDMRKLRGEIDEVLSAIIDEHKDQIAGKGPGRDPNDFISVLLKLPGQNGEANLDMSTIKALVLDMIAGATDTSAVANEWTMMEIIRHPTVQRKIQQELDSVVGLDRNVDESDLSKLPYLMCVVKESFRLHPAGPFSIPRLSLTDTKLAGYHIPKGTRVLINYHSLGRSSETWSEPLEFIPERWAAANLANLQDPEFRIMPFGHGRRGCAGANLGFTMVFLALSRLLHGFNWCFPPGVTAESVDMAETFGFTTPLRTSLRAVATPRLAPHVYIS